MLTTAVLVGFVKKEIWVLVGWCIALYLISGRLARVNAESGEEGDSSEKVLEYLCLQTVLI